jgi:hypothetical protein
MLWPLFEFVYSALYRELSGKAQHAKGYSLKMNFLFTNVLLPLGTRAFVCWLGALCMKEVVYH